MLNDKFSEIQRGELIVVLVVYIQKVEKPSQTVRIVFFDSLELTEDILKVLHKGVVDFLIRSHRFIDIKWLALFWHFLSYILYKDINYN